MCTLTVIPREDGFLLGMNRDEQLTRGIATPPELSSLTITTAVYPRDCEGGTWIAANDHGIALALLNWNDVPQPRGGKTRSRGEVIPSLINFSSFEHLRCGIGQLDLQGIWPFRLVGVFPDEKIVHEWRWNGRDMESHLHEWRPGHWFSSSLSDARAMAVRGDACERAWSEPDAGSEAWLRRLHASHANGPGPFSVCVHRENVGTLSYMEIVCDRQDVKSSYFAGSPCICHEATARVQVARALQRPSAGN